MKIELKINDIEYIAIPKEEFYECDADSKENLPSYAIINGLKVDRENYTKNGKEYFTFDEAQEAVKSVGKRLWTKEEQEAILELGVTWDTDKRGIWIGENHELKKETSASTFLPASGWRNSANGELFNQGVSGIYWSSTASTGTGAWVLNFGSGGAGVGDSVRAPGFSVRCVSE